jgi:hypothetical protein
VTCPCVDTVCNVIDGQPQCIKIPKEDGTQCEVDSLCEGVCSSGSCIVANDCEGDTTGSVSAADKMIVGLCYIVVMLFALE